MSPINLLILILIVMVVFLGIVIVWLYMERREGHAYEHDATISPITPKTNENIPKNQGELLLRGEGAPVFELWPGILTYQESRFFRTLRGAIGDRYAIYAKVRIADLMKIKNEPLELHKHRRRILCSHFDFVICDNSERQPPLLAIELDDATHSQPKAKARDEYKDIAANSAGLPLLRFAVNKYYNPEVIRERILAKIVSIE